MKDQNMAIREEDDVRQELGELNEAPYGWPNCLCDDCVAIWVNRQEELQEFEDTGGDHGEADLMDGGE